jgi:hypothetical protein
MMDRVENKIDPNVDEEGRLHMMLLRKIQQQNGKIAQTITPKFLNKLREIYTDANNTYMNRLDRFTELRARSIDAGTTEAEAAVDMKEYNQIGEELSRILPRLKAIRIAIGTNNKNIKDILDRIELNALTAEEILAEESPVTQKEFDNKEKLKKQKEKPSEINILDIAKERASLIKKAEMWVKRQGGKPSDFISNSSLAYEINSLMDIWGIPLPEILTPVKKDFRAAVNLHKQIIKEADIEYQAKVDAGEKAHIGDILFQIETKYRTAIVNDFIQKPTPAPISEQGSTSRSVNFDEFVALIDTQITSQTMLPLFEQLGHIGSKIDAQEHTDRLLEVLDNVIKLQGTIDLKVGESDSETFGVHRTFSDGSQDVHILGSKSTFTNSAQPSAQEVYVHELVHGITEYALDHNPAIRRQFKKLYTIAKKHFKYTDLLPGKGPHTNEEIAYAKELYAHIFVNVQGTKGVSSSQTSSPYLHEFITNGLTNELFIKKLATLQSSEKKTASKSIWEDMLNIFFNTVNWIMTNINGTNNLSADKALRKLVDKMLADTQKQQWSVFQIFEVMDTINQKTIDAIQNWILAPIVAYARSEKKTHVPGRVLQSLASLLDNEQLILFGKAIKQMSQNIGLTEKSFIVKLVREMEGLKKSNSRWHALLRMSKKLVDQARVHEADSVGRQLRDSFHTWDDMTREENAALYRVFMKTDLSALLHTAEKGKYTPEMLLDLLNSPKKLGELIAKVEAQLKDKEFGDNSKYYLRQAKGLGNFMSRGNDFAAGQMLNAHIIANLTNTQSKVQGDVAKAEALLDELITLYALSKVAPEERVMAADVYKRENAVDGKQNGIVTLLYLQNLNKEESLKHLFKGNKNLMTKGYTKETFNPNVDIKISPKKRTETDPITGKRKVIDIEAQMKKEGYFLIKDEPLPKDPLDPSPEVRYMFVSRNAPNTTWVKSIVSMTARKHMGTSIEDIYNTMDNEETYVASKEAIATITETMERDIRLQFKGKSTSTTLLPIVNEAGETVSYRYVMSEHTKRKVMERDDRFEYSMGRMFGSIQDKTNSPEINKQVLTIAKEDFDENYLKNPSEYVEIGPDSTDPELAEIYSLLPMDMKEMMADIWGKGEPVYIKQEFVNLVFGFRKLRLKDMDNMIGSSVRAMNESITWIMRNSFFPTAPNADIGKLWAEIVNVAKEMIVVKTGVILFPNFMSNNAIMLTKGVPPSGVARYQVEALVELDAYMKMTLERDAIKRDLKANPNLGRGKRKRMEARLAELNTDIFNNPVTTLIDKGIFQSIIEDIDFEEDIYTSRVRLTTQVQEIANKYLPDFAVTASKYAFLTKDTKPYQLLLKATQVSDFISRYALYRHRMVNMPADANKEEYTAKVLDEAVETFINYDVPTSREMQWINDMGLMMFTKFLFRIQKVILKMFKERPASAIAGLVLQDVFGEQETIDDNILSPSAIMGRVNSPWNVLDGATDPAAFTYI